MSIPKQTATMLPLQQLVAHPNNVRKTVGDISELAASIVSAWLRCPASSATTSGTWPTTYS
jgi:hypothetical protein